MSSEKPAQVYPGAAANLQKPLQGDAPKHVVEKVTNNIAANTGVTSTNRAPGAPGVPAGTALPIADFANKEARNAGVNANSVKRPEV